MDCPFAQAGKITERITLMKKAVVSACLLAGCFGTVAVDQEQTHPTPHHEMNMGPEMGHNHHTVPAVPVTFAELQHTAEQLQKARNATERYRDVRVAEAD